MKERLQKNHRLIFYGCWLLLTAIQAALTQLQDDEAYYWVYSKFLDWGYFDHPPMTALMIRSGYGLLPNELGVRLVAILMNTGSLILIEKLTNRKDPFLFYTIALSLSVLQLAGFLSVPDTPLIFFAAVFFFLYNRFLQNTSLANTTWLGLSMALLMYSKYHGVLIVFFTLISNPGLLKKYQSWLAVVFAFALFIPHLYWQYQHNWVSIRYHLFESNVNRYKFSYTLEYIGGQLLLAGPVAGLLLIPAAFLYKRKNRLERALFFTMTGIYIFFFLSSFKGKVEANWTSPAIVPLVVLSHSFISERIAWRRWLLRLLPITLLFTLIMRAEMLVDILPVKDLKLRYHAWKKWPAIMKEKTKGLPIVFDNSYQRASQYWFHTGQMTYSQNANGERRNNYNFWPIEDSMLGKPIYLLDKYRLFRFTDSVKTPLGAVGYRYDSSFASFAKVQVICSPTKVILVRKDSFTLEARPALTPQYAAFISRLRDDTRVYLSIYDEYGWLRDIYLPFTVQEFVKINHEFVFTIDLAPGKYFFRFAFKDRDYDATHNSEKVEVQVK